MSHHASYVSGVGGQACSWPPLSSQYVQEGLSSPPQRLTCSQQRLFRPPPRSTTPPSPSVSTRPSPLLRPVTACSFTAPLRRPGWSGRSPPAAHGTRTPSPQDEARERQCLVVLFGFRKEYCTLGYTTTSHPPSAGVGIRQKWPGGAQGAASWRGWHTSPKPRPGLHLQQRQKHGEQYHAS